MNDFYQPHRPLRPPASSQPQPCLVLLHHDYHGSLILPARSRPRSDSPCGSPCRIPFFVAVLSTVYLYLHQYRLFLPRRILKIWPDLCGRLAAGCGLGGEMVICLACTIVTKQDVWIVSSGYLLLDTLVFGGFRRLI